MRAFSLLEIVAIIAIIGALLTLMDPNFKSRELVRAATQVMSHIRYTQHLALSDDKFDPEDPFWFRGRWQIYFIKTVSGKKVLHYAIFSDSGGYSGSPDAKEIAKNPLNPSKHLAVAHAGISTIIPSHELDLMQNYGVVDIKLSGKCSNNRLSFDSLGRPYTGNPKSSTTPSKGLIERVKPGDTCAVTLEHKSGTCISITIEPYTGYSELGELKKC